MFDCWILDFFYFFFFFFLGWLVSFSLCVLLLYCLRENGRMSLSIYHHLDSIERMQDRIEYLEESLYEFY
jgi:hypothetical protein